MFRATMGKERWLHVAALSRRSAKKAQQTTDALETITDKFGDRNRPRGDDRCQRAPALEAEERARPPTHAR